MSRRVSEQRRFGTTLDFAARPALRGVRRRRPPIWLWLVCAGHGLGAIGLAVLVLHGVGVCR